MSVVVNQPYSTAGSGGRKLAYLSNGWIVAVTKTNDYFYFYVDRNDGNGFVQLCWIYHSSINNNDIAIASFGNKVYAYSGWGTSNTLFWSIDVVTQSNVDIYNSRVVVDSSQSAIGNVTLAIDPLNGHLHAAHSSKNTTRPNSFNIRYAKSEDNGATWTVEQVTTHNISGRNSNNPTIVISNSMPTIIFDDLSGSTYYIWSNSRTENGWSNYSFGRGVNVYSSDTTPQTSPSAVVKDGVIYLTWISGTTIIRYRRSFDGGVTWDSDKNLINISGLKSHSFTISKDDILHVLYSNSSGISRISSSITDNFSNSSRVEVISGGDNPSTLFDPTFTGEFGDTPLSIYQTSTSVEIVGAYITNQAPTLTLKDSVNQPITQNQTIKHTNITPFLFKILTNDADVSDNLQYSIFLRNSEYQTWTNISKGVETSISIPFANLLIGNNTIQVKVRDNKGAETSITFVVGNINPQSYCQKHVYELIVALGYAPTGNSSLRALKYPEYNKSTLSLAELVNFLQ